MVTCSHRFISRLLLTLLVSTNASANSVHVAPGEYDERLAIHRAIHLIGAGDRLAVIRPTRSGETVDIVLGAGSSGSRLEGFFFDFSNHGTRGGPYTGIKVGASEGDSTGIRIESNVIHIGAGADSIGIETRVDADVCGLVVKDNVITGMNDCHGGSIGLYIHPRLGDDPITILDNDISGSLRAGIVVDADRVVIQGNAIADTFDHASDAGILVLSSVEGVAYDRIDIANNHISDMRVGVDIGGNSISGSTWSVNLTSNIFRSNRETGVLARMGARIIAAGNSFIDQSPNARDDSIGSIWRDNDWDDFASNVGHPVEYWIPGTAGAKDRSPVGGYSILSWPIAMPITAGQTLSQSTLVGGVASIPGLFEFVHPKQVFNRGIHNVCVKFTPTGAFIHAPVTGTIPLLVNSSTSYNNLTPTPTATAPISPPPTIAASVTPQPSATPFATATPLPSITQVQVWIDPIGVLCASWNYPQSPDSFILHLYKNGAFEAREVLDGDARETRFEFGEPGSYRVWVAAVYGKRRNSFVGSNFVEWKGEAPTPTIPISLPTTTPIPVPKDRLFVTVTDSLLCRDDVSGNAVKNANEDRSLVVRWDSSFEEERYDYHIYVQINGGGFDYLGRAGGGDANYFLWNDKPPHGLTALPYRDGPQFGDAYRFRVYPMFTGPPRGHKPGVFFENSAPVLFIEGETSTLNAHIAVALNEDSLDDLSGGVAYVAEADRRLIVHWNFDPRLPDIIDYHVYMQTRDADSPFAFLGNTRSGEARSLRWSPRSSRLFYRGPEFNRPYRFRVFPISDGPIIAPFGAFESGDAVVLREVEPRLKLSELIVTSSETSFANLSGLFVRQPEDELGLTIRWNLFEPSVAGYRIFVVPEGDDPIFIAELKDPTATLYHWGLDCETIGPTYGIAYSFIVIPLNANGDELRAIHSGDPVRILDESQTPIDSVIVSDSLLSASPLPNHRDLDPVHDRQLVIRWNLEREKGVMIHIYVSVNGAERQYLGRTQGDAHDYFEWRPGLPPRSLNPIFADGPQHGQRYRFSVFALYENGTAGPFIAPNEILYEIESSL